MRYLITGFMIVQSALFFCLFSLASLGMLDGQIGDVTAPLWAGVLTMATVPLFALLESVE